MYMEIARKSYLNAICRQSGINGNRKIERQMAIENPVSKDFYLRWSIVLTFSIAAYPV